ncbi:MAG TPA: hypothetical protein VN641_01255 [Urbifossiella sp.]|nr:hypothetical protein [Urbifossiella sp.]
MKRIAAVILGLMICFGEARAERPPQARDKAKLVVAATVKKITSKESSFGGDGTRTAYTAEVVVDSVESGDGVKVKPGEKLTVAWFHVTKKPSGPFVGAYGHGYDIKEKDRAKFWLMPGGQGVAKGAWAVIYNKNGVEKIKK